MAAVWHRLIGFIAQMVTKQLDEQQPNKLGVVKSVLFGIPLPLCSCSVIPTGLGLEKQVRAKGSTVGFLIAHRRSRFNSCLSQFSRVTICAPQSGNALVTGLIGGYGVEKG